MKKDLYTLRWYINHFNSDSKAASLRILAKLLGETEPVERPPVIESPKGKKNNARSLYYPLAETNFPESKTRGKYPAGGPEGAIVHWTSGWPDQSLESALSYQARKGYTYFAIDADGNVGQNFPLNRWGYHAGKSYWPGLGNYVSNRIVGIEVICSGRLESNDAPWFDKRNPYPADKIREADRKDRNIVAGRYYKYTEAQEEALETLLIWLWGNFEEFTFDNVLGHDEISPGRKSDPGASLSMAMPDYRSYLKKQAHKIL